MSPELFTIFMYTYIKNVSEGINGGMGDDVNVYVYFSF